jgi:hypothetical protein
MANKMNLIDQQQLQFSRVLELSDLMLVSAQDERWESVTELQLLRESLLHDFFASDLEMDNQSISVGINHMLDTDKKLARLAEKERSLLQGQINKIKQGKNVVKAYAG